MSLSRFTARITLGCALACLALFPVAASAGTYSVLPHATSAPIFLPAGVRIVVAHVQSNSTDGGLAQITTAVDADGSINWVGLEASHGVTPTLVQGRSNLAGTHVAYIDRNNTVAIETFGPNHILIRNRTFLHLTVTLDIGSIHE
jgi:hypothetical protein